MAGHPGSKEYLVLECDRHAGGVDDGYWDTCLYSVPEGSRLVVGVPCNSNAEPVKCPAVLFVDECFKVADNAYDPNEFL